MECPHCGFVHLIDQQRCAKCKKVMTEPVTARADAPEPIPETFETPADEASAAVRSELAELLTPSELEAVRTRDDLDPVVMAEEEPGPELTLEPGPDDSLLRFSAEPGAHEDSDEASLHGLFQDEPTMDDQELAALLSPEPEPVDEPEPEPVVMAEPVDEPAPEPVAMETVPAEVEEVTQAEPEPLMLESDPAADEPTVPDPPPEPEPEETVQVEASAPEPVFEPVDEPTHVAIEAEDSFSGLGEGRTGELFAKTLREVEETLARVQASVDAKAAARAASEADETTGNVRMDVVDDDEQSQICISNCSDDDHEPAIHPDSVSLKEASVEQSITEVPPRSAPVPVDRSRSLIDLMAEQSRDEVTGAGEVSADGASLGTFGTYGTFGADDDVVEPIDAGGVRVLRAREHAHREPLPWGLLLRRAGAGLFDFAVWLGIGAVLYEGARLMGGYAAIRGTAGEWAVLVALPLTIMSAILALIYGGLFTGMAGRTPGMMLMGLTVVEQGGARPGLYRSFKRAGLYLLGLAPAGLGLLTLIPQGETSWFDRVTGTTVQRG